MFPVRMYKYKKKINQLYLSWTAIFVWAPRPSAARTRFYRVLNASASHVDFYESQVVQRRDTVLGSNLAAAAAVASQKSAFFAEEQTVLRAGLFGAGALAFLLSNTHSSSPHNVLASFGSAAARSLFVEAHGDPPYVGQQQPTAASNRSSFVIVRFRVSFSRKLLMDGDIFHSHA